MRRRSPARWTRVAVGVAGLLLLAACGDDGDAPSAGSVDDGDQNEAAVDVEQEATEEATEARGGRARATAFQALLEGDAPVAITYRATGDDREAMTLTFARDGSTSAIEGSADGGAFRMLQPGDGSLVVCGQESGAWECMRMGGLGDLLGGAMVPLAPVLFDLREVLADAAWEQVEHATIAGRSALCASTSLALLPDVGEVVGRTEVCADEETGALLRMASDGADGAVARLEAIDVGDPDPGMLAAPAEPRDLDLLGDLLDGLGLDDLDLHELDGLELDLRDLERLFDGADGS